MIENIRKALDNFNKNKSNEVSASLIESDNHKIKVKFSGNLLCDTCCLNDYFEDLTYNFKDNGINNKVKWINVDNSHLNYVVEYEIL